MAQEPQTTPSVASASFDSGKDFFNTWIAQPAQDLWAWIQKLFADPQGTLKNLWDSLQSGQFVKNMGSNAQGVWDALKETAKNPSQLFGGAVGALGGWILANLFGLPGWLNLPVMIALTIGGGYMGLGYFSGSSDETGRSSASNDRRGQGIPLSRRQYYDQAPRPDRFAGVSDCGVGGCYRVAEAGDGPFAPTPTDRPRDGMRFHDRGDA